LRGHWVEGRGWLERALAIGEVVTPDIRVRLLLGSGVFSLRQGDYARATGLLEDSQALARRLGDRTLTALSLFVLGNVAGERPEPDYPLALARFETALAMFRSLGQHYWVARITNNLGNIALAQGEAVRATGYFEEALALNRNLGSTWGVASALGNLAGSLVAQGELARAEVAVRESLALSQILDSRHMQSAALETLAQIAAGQQQFEQAVRWWGTAEGLRHRLNMALPTPDRSTRMQSMDAARRRLGDAVFETCWATGYAAASTNTVDALLGGGEQVSRLAHSTGTSHALVATPSVNLSRREQEILRLLVEGHSNQEIGAALFISAHTAAKHVANILGKLGVESRTAAATYALRHGLVER
jgi:ATP/maltotriose-dependent transcriptional regulator MalT